MWTVNNHTLHNVDELLRYYVATDDNAPEMPQLRQIRDQMLDNLEQVTSAAEVTGLIHWLIRDNSVNAAGETLDETAERLGDLDIEADTDQYTTLIFQIKMAIERIDEILLDDY